MEKYYAEYQRRYLAIAGAGIDIWGHSEDDLRDVLTRWVDENRLRGKRVVEFACGEGSGGVILSQLGCRYLGVDIAPYAVEKTCQRLSGFPGAQVLCLDLAAEAPEGEFDAALDVSGLHMLVTDAHRQGYLGSMRKCLKPGAPVLLHCEAYRSDFPQYNIETLDQWAEIVGIDFKTPQRRELNGREVMLTTLPARPLSREGYAAELRAAGFELTRLIPMNEHEGRHLAAEIHARRL